MNWMEARAPISGRLEAIDLDCNHIPDAAMTLAVVALFAEGTTRCATSRAGASRKPTASRRWRPSSEVGATVEEGRITCALRRQLT